MKKITHIEILTNLLFLIPIIISIKYHLQWYTIAIGTAFIVSILFHLSSEEKLLFYIDVFFSCILMFFNFVLLFLGHWRLPYSLGAILCAGMALIFYARQNKFDNGFNHSLWHVFSVGVCLFSIFTFMLF